METKEELLLYKSALEKLIDKIDYIGISYEKYLGLCSLSSCFLNSEEKKVFTKGIEKYAQLIGRGSREYYWNIGDKLPRKQWLEYELSIVNQELKQYDSFSTKVKANIEGIRLFMKLINKR